MFSKNSNQEIYRTGALASFLWSMARPAAFVAPQRRGIGPVPTGIQRVFRENFYWPVPFSIGRAR
jgi:hypothetical protein